MARPVEADALVCLWVAPEGVQPAPVEKLTWVAGTREAGYSSLLVAGGQLPDQPGLLSVLPLLPEELARVPAHDAPVFCAERALASMLPLSAMLTAYMPSPVRWLLTLTSCIACRSVRLDCSLT